VYPQKCNFITMIYQNIPVPELFLFSILNEDQG